jgi:carboxymethylenebutenolidase
MIGIPFDCHFANKDDWCTPEAVDALEATLKKAGVNGSIYRYDAEHAFMNEQRTVHDRAAAELAWGRMLKFWEKHLSA